MTNKNNTVAKVFSLIITLLTVLTAISFTALSASDSKVIALKYDDYYNDYKSISILDCGEPESFKVGFGVPEGTRDDAVVAVDDGVLHAVGIGTARVEIDGKVYTVKVEPAPISMFLLIGQSNMYGNEGNEGQSVANVNGTAYSTVGESTVITIDNATSFVPSALSGQCSTVNTVGTTENLENNPVNRLTESGKGKIGLDSGLAYNWHKLTGDKVWLVNVAKGTTTIDKWTRGAERYNIAVSVFKAAQETMRKEIAAGHYVLNDYGYFWLQGCTDRANTAEYYIQNFLSMHEALKNDLAFDVDSDGEVETLNFCNVIMPRMGKDDCIGYRHGVNTDKTDKRFYQTFLDLEMNGPRVAQYWLTNNPEHEDINLVCNIGDSWVYMPDGSNAVEEYFASKYENGRVDYPIQMPQSEEWYTPRTPQDVHDNIHYNQVGYNEIGLEAAKNSAYVLSRVEKPEDVETKVTFYDWTGYKEVNGIDALSWADSKTLVVPVVYPVYESKNVTYELSDNLEYKYYDLTAKYGTTGGTLTTVGADNNKIVNIHGKSQFKKGENIYYYTETITGLKENSGDMYSNNPLTIVAGSNGEGKVENGVHQKVIYKFDKTVNLLNNNEWLVEWTGKSEGTKKQSQSFIILSENIFRRNISMGEINYFWHRYSAPTEALSLTLGKSNQIGKGYQTNNISLDENPYQLHTYRIWNKVNQDGTNTIHLSVDGVYCGEFSSESGKDFAFKYIGANDYEVDNYIISSLKIIENYNCEILGHSLVESRIEQSCTTERLKKIQCFHCDYSYNVLVEKIEHDFSTDYVTDNNATYLSDGTKSKKCLRCNLKYTVADKNSKLILSRPAKVKAIAEATTVNLSWEPCKDAWGYRVYMLVNGKWKALKTTRATSYTVTGLTEGTNYTFAVRAYTYVGKDCVWSPTYTKVDVSTKLATPKIRVASTAKGRASVAWNDIEGETGYQVWYSTKKNGKYIKASNYSADTVKIYKTGLNSQATYYFKVRAYKRTDTGYVYSDFSNVRSVTLK